MKYLGIFIMAVLFVMGTASWAAENSSKPNQRPQMNSHRQWKPSMDKSAHGKPKGQQMGQPPQNGQQSNEQMGEMEMPPEGTGENPNPNMENSPEKNGEQMRSKGPQPPMGDQGNMPGRRPSKKPDTKPGGDRVPPELASGTQASTDTVKVASEFRADKKLKGHHK